MVFLLFPLIFAGGYLAFDFWMVNRSRWQEGDGVSVTEYLSGWLSLGGAVSAAVTDDPDAPALPGDLAAMLPKPPEGWTVRPAEPADADAFIDKGADKKAADYVRAVLKDRSGKGLEQVRQTYQNGGKTVVFELVRYPDFIFTSFAAMHLKFELQMSGPEFRPTDFMTVRGLEMREDLLPDGIAMRYFVGDVSDQIWVRVLASRGLADEDMLAFFQTLHVPAMNARVVEKVAGMGEVPVIVLASVIDAETRAARESEQAAEAERLAEERAKAEAEMAEQAAAEEAKQEAEERGETTDEETGVKIRKGAGEGTQKAKKGGGSAGFGDGGCSVEGGRKVCGGIEEAPAEE